MGRILYVLASILGAPPSGLAHRKARWGPPARARASRAPRRGLFVGTLAWDPPARARACRAPRRGLFPVGTLAWDPPTRARACRVPRRVPRRGLCPVGTLAHLTSLPRARGPTSLDRQPRAGVAKAASGRVVVVAPRTTTTTITTPPGTLTGALALRHAGPARACAGGTEWVLARVHGPPPDFFAPLRGGCVGGTQVPSGIGWRVDGRGRPFLDFLVSRDRRESMG